MNVSVYVFMFICLSACLYVCMWVSTGEPSIWTIMTLTSLGEDWGILALMILFACYNVPDIPRIPKGARLRPRRAAGHVPWPRLPSRKARSFLGSLSSRCLPSNPLVSLCIVSLIRMSHDEALSAGPTTLSRTIMCLPRWSITVYAELLTPVSPG